VLAATIRDGRVAVEEHPDPTPGSGECLVRVRAAGINGADLLQRKGLYPAPPGSPELIPGLELAGEVEAIGVDVGDDHVPRAGVLDDGDGHQADRTRAGYQHVLTQQWPLQGGVHRVAERVEQSCHVQVDAFRMLPHV